MADVHVITNEAGDYFVGFEADGVFVPIGGASAARVKQVQERAANLAELAKSDDPEAVKRHDVAAQASPYSVKGSGKSSTGSTSKGGAS
jgi:hypothetical protein